MSFYKPNIFWPLPLSPSPPPTLLLFVQSPLTTQEVLMFFRFITLSTHCSHNFPQLACSPNSGLSPNVISSEKPSLHDLMPVKLAHTPQHTHSQSSSPSLSHSPPFTHHLSLPCNILYIHLFVYCDSTPEYKLYEGRDAVFFTIMSIVTQYILNEYLVNEEVNK